MPFETFFSAQSVFLWSAFLLAFIMGAVVNKTNFCTMGAVSDMVNIGDYGRFRAWLLAIAVALIGVLVLEAFSLVHVDTTFPPYRAGELIWAENLLGGLLFGIGMTLASGCGNKTLVRLGSGNLKSVFVILVIAIVAYYMLNPFPGSDKTLFSTLFHGWMRPLAVSLAGSQDLGALVAAQAPGTARLVIGTLLALGLLWIIFKCADFRTSSDNILGGLVVGLAILGAWFITSNIQVDADGDLLSLGEYYEQWDLLADSEEGKPAQGRLLRPQSYAFISPMAQTFGYVSGKFNPSLLTFGVMAFFGVVAGSFAWAVVSRSFRLEWFRSLRDFMVHIIGAVLMGLGGTLALGCTIGQAITGVSTLALGSFITCIAIVLGAALTMKVVYYRMVYEEAGFIRVLVAALADLRLLPSALRRLDKV